MMAPISKSCHATCCGLGFTSAKFCANKNVPRRKTIHSNAAVLRCVQFMVIPAIREQAATFAQPNYLANWSCGTLPSRLTNFATFSSNEATGGMELVVSLLAEMFLPLPVTSGFEVPAEV